MKFQLSLQMGQSGDFPGAPEKDTIAITEEEYNELWDRFIKPKAIAEGWAE